MGSIEKIISDQVRTWHKTNEIVSRKNNKPEVRPVITISREYGALGGPLSDELGKKIGFKVWDKTLLSAIADEAGADEKFLSSLDEHRRKIIEDTLYETFMGAKHSNTNYFRSLNKVVQTLGEHGSSIIVGRGANYILKSKDHLRVRIVSPIKTRISNVSIAEKVSLKEAEKMVISRDAERNDFIKHYFKKDLTNIHDFDITLNSSTYSIEQLATLIIQAYELKVGKLLSVPVL